jgi:hypothetical protein
LPVSNPARISEETRPINMKLLPCVKF